MPPSPTQLKPPAPPLKPAPLKPPAAVTGGYGPAFHHMQEKSDAASAREAAAREAFDNLRNSAHFTELSTNRLLAPSEHLTAPCYRDFAKYVKSFPCWRASRIAATDAQKEAAGETRKGKVYFTSVTFRPAKANGKAAQKPQKKQKATAEDHLPFSLSEGSDDAAPATKKPKRYLWLAFEKGDAVFYIKKGDEVRNATIVGLHHIDAETTEPFYTIQFADGASPQRQTTSEMLKAATDASSSGGGGDGGGSNSSSSSSSSSSSGAGGGGGGRGDIDSIV